MTTRARHRPPARPLAGVAARSAAGLRVVLLAVAVAVLPVLLLAFVVVAAGPVGPAQAAQPASAAASAASAASAAESARTPLQVSIDTLAPATIPRHGRVTVTGRITNRSQETWTGLKVYLLTSSEPITTRSALSEAADSDAAAEVGERRADAGLFQNVGDLDPGGSVAYRLSLRRRDLGITGAPGVYWVGVHVLGASGGARDSVADGRARTFMPLMPTGAGAATDRTRLSLLLPLRASVRRGAAGRLLDVPGWQRTFGPDGRLDRLLGLSGQSGGALTWVVDPAVVDAAASLARGNPSADPAPATGPGTRASASPSASATSTPDASGSTDGASGDGSDDAATTAAARAAGSRWLTELRRQAGSRTVMSLAYGDLDVSATLDAGRAPLYARARSLGADVLSRSGVTGASPVVDPAGGYLSPTAAARLPDGAPVVLGRQAVPSAPGAVVDLTGASRAVVTDAAAASGGPRPGPRYGALAVRQRILAEAALHALSTDRTTPLVVAMPARWDPGAGWRSARFFAGLDQPWLQLVDLPEVLATDTGAPAGRLTYPPSQSRLELPMSNLDATAALVRAGSLFARVLTGDDHVDDVLARVAVLASSATTRKDPAAATALAGATLAHVRGELSQVRVEGPPFVMMSGESGPIQVSLVNDLAQTVTVGLRMSTPGSDLRIAKVAPVRLGPGKRASIRLSATSHDIGVHAVSLRVTDTNGHPIGSQTRFNVRTSHVSTVIWVVMAVGGALLLVAIVIRLYRRVRRRKATHGPRLARTTAATPGVRGAADVPDQGLNA